MSDQFPDDENGDVLRRMVAAGDDISKPRVIEFSLLFGSLEEARGFVEAAKELRTKVVIEDDASDENVVDVTVKKEMIPSHQAISKFEKELDRIARPFGGRNDGWGCLSV